jgi:hypothetical protein
MLQVKQAHNGLQPIQRIKCSVFIQKCLAQTRALGCDVQDPTFERFTAVYADWQVNGAVWTGNPPHIYDRRE